MERFIQHTKDRIELNFLTSISLEGSKIATGSILGTG